MKELKNNLESLSKEELIHMVDLAEKENITLAATLKTYQDHLERTIEYRSVEKYRKHIKSKGVV